MSIDKILKSGQPLEKFEYQSLQTSIFKDSTQQLVPNFFRQHSLDQTHKIKYFVNDPQANIKVFYFQYLKLCFQSENTHKKLFYISRIEDLILNKDFQFIFEQQISQQQTQNMDLQYKRLVLQFFEYLQQEDKTVQQALGLFPIMDTVFVSFFRTLLISMDLTSNYDNKIDASSFYEFLISYFGIQTESFQFCIKFKDTDVYVYEEKASLVFIAYCNENSKIHESNQQSQSIEEDSVLEGSGRDFFLRMFGKQQAQEVQQPKHFQISNQFSLKDFLFQNLQKQQLEKKLIKHAKTSSGSIQPPSDSQLDKKSTLIVDYNNDIHWNNLIDIEEGEPINLLTSKMEIDFENRQRIQSQNNFPDFFKHPQPSKRIAKKSYKAQRVQTEPKFETGKKIRYQKQRNIKNIRKDQSILCFRDDNKENQYIPTQYRPFQKKEVWKNYEITAETEEKDIIRLKQKINITEQFTKTFILKQLRSPCLQNVSKMKQRSRVSRDNFLKNWIHHA